MKTTFILADSCFQIECGFCFKSQAWSAILFRFLSFIDLMYPIFLLLFKMFEVLALPLTYTMLASRVYVIKQTLFYWRKYKSQSEIW